MKTILQINNLQKSFASPDGKPQVIIDVDQFSLNKGDQVALKGTSGSGKTTYLNLISGILGADKGSIQISGKDICQLPESDRDTFRAKHIGYIFQTFNLLQGYTALENVMMGMMFSSAPDKKRGQELLDRVGLKNRMDYLPSQLSVGQQQRVAVARSMVNSPDLVLADEPTGNLDPHMTIETIELIHSLTRERKTTLLLVTHDKDVMDCFDQVQDFHQLNGVLRDV